MPGPDHVKHLFRQYDIEATSYTYGTLSDLLQAPKYLKTSGSSTTVSENTAGEAVFDGFGVGDVLYVNVDGTWTARPITSVAGAPTSVTVATAVDWSSGKAFYFRRFTTGTAAGSGWFPVADFAEKSVNVELATIGATSIDVSIEGRINATATASVLYSKNYLAATAPAADIFAIGEHVTEIRVGFKANTPGTANSVTANFFGRASTR